MKSLYLSYLAFVMVAMTVISCGSDSMKITLSSPAASIRTQVDISEKGELSYMVFWGNDTIISSSRLGLVADGDTLSDGFVVTNSFTEARDTTWNMPWGQNKVIRDRYKALIVELKHKPSGRQLAINFRSHQDGVAIRYQLPAGFAKVINDELTEICVTKNPTVWWSMADFNTYEKSYNKTPLDSASWVATPVIMRRCDGRHIALNEAAIVDYPDMTLKNMGGGRLKVELTPWKNGDKVRLSGDALNSPWRMITVAADAKGIVGSSTMLNLAPECMLSDVEYCKPMTYVGVWWEFHLGTKEWKAGIRQGATTFEAMRYIDFAARNNIAGVVVEGWNKGWDKWGQKDAFDYVTPAANYDLRAVAEYARNCGVRLIMHHETGADIEGYEKLMDSAFLLCHKLNISDVKTGHAGRVSTGENHHGQQMVEHFARIVSTAAKYGIALDMHEPIKGSGLERTYPNFMTREAVRGMEWEAWSEGNSPSHTTLLPFTRGLTGPTDYTPGIFDVLLKKARGRVAWNAPDSVVKQTRVHSTLAHQLGLMVTLYSPWVMAADKIDNYENHPAFQFVRDLNPDYDQTLILEAQIGDCIVTARRSGTTWFVGGTTNETEREIRIQLYFLTDGMHTITIYRDGDKAHWMSNPTDYIVETKEVSNRDMLTIRMAAGGGFAIVVK